MAVLCHVVCAPHLGVPFEEEPVRLKSRILASVTELMMWMKVSVYPAVYTKKVFRSECRWATTLRRFC